ncbi:hypothetical protein [Streptomyces sp. NPDC055189]
MRRAGERRTHRPGDPDALPPRSPRAVLLGADAACPAPGADGLPRAGLTDTRNAQPALGIAGYATASLLVPGPKGSRRVSPAGGAEPGGTPAPDRTAQGPLYGGGVR